MQSRVLVIHSNQSLGVEIQTALCSAAIDVDAVFSPSEAVDLFLRYDYSLILIDADTDGKEIIKPLRAITNVFKKTVGCTPMEYRNRQGKN